MPAGSQSCEWGLGSAVSPCHTPAALSSRIKFMLPVQPHIPASRPPRCRDLSYQGLQGSIPAPSGWALPDSLQVGLYASYPAHALAVFVWSVCHHHTPLFLVLVIGRGRDGGVARRGWAALLVNPLLGAMATLAQASPACSALGAVFCWCWVAQLRTSPPAPVCHDI